MYLQLSNSCYHVTGAPNVNLTGVKTNIAVQVTPLGGDKYRAFYMPQMHGKARLNI